MIEKNINDKKKLNQQQPSFYDNDVFEFDKIINGYYKLIGGDNNNYDKETSRRLQTFGEELLKKRSMKNLQHLRPNMTI